MEYILLIAVIIIVVFAIRSLRLSSELNDCIEERDWVYHKASDTSQVLSFRTDCLIETENELRAYKETFGELDK